MKLWLYNCNRAMVLRLGHLILLPEIQVQNLDSSFIRSRLIKREPGIPGHIVCKSNLSHHVGSVEMRQLNLTHQGVIDPFLPSQWSLLIPLKASENQKVSLKRKGLSAFCFF